MRRLYCTFGRYSGLGIEGMQLRKRVKCSGDVAMGWRQRRRPSQRQASWEGIAVCLLELRLGERERAGNSNLRERTLVVKS